MRRVLILILLLALVGVGVAAILVLGGGDGGGPETETAEVGGEGGGGEGQEEQPTPTPRVIPVVIAVQDIARGTRITEADVQVRFWPDISETEDAAFNARIQSTDEVIGRLARTDIPIYSPVVRAQLVEDPALLGQTGSDVATLVDPNRVVISVPLDPTGIGQVAYGLQPGDSVDIIMTFAFVDVDEFFQTRIPNTLSVVAATSEGNLVFTDPTLGTPEENIFQLSVFNAETGEIGTATLSGAIGPSEKIQRPRIVTQLTITGAEVMWVGYFPENGQIYGRPTPTPFEEPQEPTPVGTPPPPPEQETPAPSATPYIPLIMSLALEPQDAVELTWAVESGIPITYALRSANINNDVVIADTTAVTLSYIRNQYAIPDPNTLRLNYALEPRPVIRRFDLGSLRQFVELQADVISDQAADPLREDLLREDLFIGGGGGG